MALSKTETLALKTAAARLRKVSDPAVEDIGVPAAHRATFALYVRTWILPIVEGVATPAAERSADVACILQSAARKA